MSDFETLVRRAVHETLAADVVGFEPLDAGLGLRRFARVRLAGGAPATCIARLEASEDPRGRPTGVPPEPPLEPVRALLERAGLPVPRRLGGDADAGLDLLEDLGALCLRDAVTSAAPDQRRALYEAACDLVPRLQRVVDPGGAPPFARSLDAAHLRYKADLFADHALRATGAARACVHEAFAHIERVVRAAPRRLAHRDLQSTNLLVLAPGPPPRLGLIDLQGAFLAPPEYDLVCLLRDSYAELPAEEVAAHAERVRPRLPDAPDADTFSWRFDLLTIARKGKDCARFLYAARERGDRRFLACIPATLRALRVAAERAAAREPALGDLAALVAALPEIPCAP